MMLIGEAPDRSWNLFRSVNRFTHIEALLEVNGECEYSNYFLSREVCIQLLSEYFSQKKHAIQRDETGDDWDELEPPAIGILNWLLRTGQLRKVDSYVSMTVNIVLPDYATVMIEAFSCLSDDDEDETQVYIQNVYAILFFLRNDPRSGVSLLNTTLANMKKLNKSLQDMLHNMNKPFGSLLEQKNYGTLLRERLEGYVTEIVSEKHHILKTSDNFYLYRTDIKSWTAATRKDSSWVNKMCAKSATSAGGQKEMSLMKYDIIEKLDQLEHGFGGVEHRISNIDKEHTRYAEAAVTHLNRPLNQENNMKRPVIKLLNHVSEYSCPEGELTAVSARANLSQMTILSERSLYKRRRTKTDFTKWLKDEEESKELPMEGALNLNKVRNRYSQKEIEAFIKGSMADGRMVMDGQTMHSDQDLEKLVLAYNYSTRRTSPYKVEEEDSEMVHSGSCIYPRLAFVRRTK